jgi:hypothetical protein
MVVTIMKIMFMTQTASDEMASLINQYLIMTKETMPEMNLQSLTWRGKR